MRDARSTRLRTGGTVVGLVLPLVLVLALATASPAPAQDRPGPVKIGVLAERGTERCLEKWGPTAEYLTEQIPGCSFVIVPLSHDEVYPTVERGEVDFVFANPSLYVEAEVCYGVNQLATFKKPRLTGVFSVYGGVILCRADREDIQELSDLKGGTFMAVKETSFGGWRAVWRELKTKGIDPHRDFTELLFGGTHDAVIYAVRDGKVDAACVRTNTLEYMTMEGKIRREQFRVLNEHSWDEYPFLNSTPMYPEWPFAKVAHTSDELAEKVAVALIGMPADSPAAKAARCAGWTVPLNYQPVHECLKELRIGPYKDYGKVTLADVIRQYWPWLVVAAVFLAVAAMTTVRMLRLNRRLSRSRLDLSRELSERQQAEERYRSLFEHLSDAAFVAEAQTGIILDANKEAGALLGRSRDEIIGTHQTEFHPPAQRERCRRQFKEHVARGGGEQVENEITRQDGTAVPVVISTTLMTLEGKRCLVGLFRDITERKQAELELRKAHRETKQLLESIPSVLISVADDERVTAWNATAERLLGIEAKDALGQFLHELEIEWDHATIARSIAECRARNRPTRLDEVRFKQTDGTEGFLGITLNPINGVADKSAGFLLVASDVTERRILQGQLAQAQKLESIGQLAAGIAHEINTPVQYVGDNIRFLSDSVKDLIRLIGCYRDMALACGAAGGDPDIAAKTETLERESDLPYLEEELPKAVEQGLDGVDRVTRIVRAMKDFSHPGGEGKAAADLNKAIESTVTVARNEWKYVAEMVTDFDPALPHVPCLVGDFNQVILNIVINAAHAIAGVVGNGAGGKGTITVSTRRDGDWAEIRVRDTGTGIPEEHRSKVFDPFFTTKKVGKGTGQGLAIAYSVVTEKHDGTITFETETGKGTTFIIRLPIKLESAATEEAPHHEKAYSLR